jgi:hypothetical protein
MIFMHCELLSQSGESCKENNAIDGLSTEGRRLARETFQTTARPGRSCGQIQDPVSNRSGIDGEKAKLLGVRDISRLARNSHARLGTHEYENDL